MSNYSTLELQPESAPPRRRRRWIALIATAAVLLLVGSLGLYLALRGGTAHPSATPTTGPSPTASSSPSPVPSPSSSAQPSPTTTTPGPVSNGLITYDQLKNATLNIPAWPTDNQAGPSGRLTFTGGEVTWTTPDPLYPVTVHVVIDKSVRYGDVDRDGKAEALVVIGCYTQGGSEQLVAFDRDSTGRIVTLGTVVATTGTLRAIDTAFTIASNGVVSVRVGDYESCCGDATPVLWQTRQYGWTGRGFGQVGGPTAFPVNPSVTEIGVTSPDLVFGRPLGTERHATLAVTVTHGWGVMPDHLTIGLSVPVDVKVDGSSLAPPEHPYQMFSFDVPAPPVGASATYTYELTRPAAGAGDRVWVTVRGQAKGYQLLSEANPYNNDVRLPIRTAS